MLEEGKCDPRLCAGEERGPLSEGRKGPPDMLRGRIKNIKIKIVILKGKTKLLN